MTAAGGPLGMGVLHKVREKAVGAVGFFDKTPLKGITPADFDRLRGRVDKVEADLRSTITKLQETVGNLSTLANEVKSGLSKRVSGAEAKVASLGNDVRDAAATAKAAAGKAAAAVTSIEEAASAAGKANLKDAVTRLLDEASRARALASDASAKVVDLQALKTSITSALNNAGLKDIADLIRDTRDRISKAKADAIAEAKAKLDAAKAEVVGKIDAVKKSVTQVVTTVKCVLDTTKGLITKFADLSGVVDKLKGVVNALGDLFGPIKDAFAEMKRQYGVLKDDMETGGSDRTKPAIWDAVATAIKIPFNLIGNIADGMGKVKDKFKGDFQAGFGDLKAKFDAAKNEYEKCKDVAAPAAPASLEARAAAAATGVGLADGPVRRFIRREVAGVRAAVRRKAGDGPAKSAPADSWSSVPEAVDKEWEV